MTWALASFGYPWQPIHMGEQVPFSISHNKRRLGGTRKDWFSGHLKAVSRVHSVLFRLDFQQDSKQSGTPRIKKPINDSNARGLVEETGAIALFYGLQSSLLGACLPNDKAIVLSVVSETQEET